MDEMHTGQRRPPTGAGESSSLPPLYGIADADALGLENVAAAAAAMAAAGIGWIQVRIKQADDRQRYQVADACCRALEGADCDLWLDDRADLALVLAFDGVHVGQHDLPPAAVRKVAGDALRIGYSCHSAEQVAAADLDPAVDVVAIGPVFTTRSKQHPDPEVGLEGVREARAATTKPLVAIGGIDDDRLPRVLAEGADAAVVLGALCRGDVAKNSRRLVAIAEACR